MITISCRLHVDLTTNRLPTHSFGFWEPLRRFFLDDVLAPLLD